MKAMLLILLVVFLSGCAALGPTIPKRVYNPVTMIAGEWPY